MLKALGVSLVVAFVLTVAPAQAGSATRHLERGRYLGVWHRRHQGFRAYLKVTPGVPSESSVVLQRQRIAVRFCGSASCRRQTRADYQAMRRRWHSMNEQLWAEAARLPSCAQSSGNCVTWVSQTHAFVRLGGVRYRAFNRPRT